jgi:hypothetical protein
MRRVPKERITGAGAGEYAGRIRKAYGDKRKENDAFFGRKRNNDPKTKYGACA